MNQTNTYFSGSLFVCALVVGVVLIVHSAMTTLLSSRAPADMSPEAVIARIAPVGKLNTGPAIIPETSAGIAAVAPPPVVVAARSGQEVYNTSCQVCHAAGVAGAPKFGDVAAWAPRIATGMDTLLQSVINGKNAMPPRGTCSACSDDELKIAIEYIIENSQ